jgi:hypothetical protein
LPSRTCRALLGPRSGGRRLGSASVVEVFAGNDRRRGFESVMVRLGKLSRRQG